MSIDGGQLAADPDAVVTEEAVGGSAPEVEVVDPPEPSDLETYILDGDEVLDLARDVALMTKDVRPVWIDATYVPEFKVTIVNISGGEKINWPRHLFKNKWARVEADGESNAFNVDDVEMLMQEMGLLDNSPEFAVREDNDEVES